MSLSKNRVSLASIGFVVVSIVFSIVFSIFSPQAGPWINTAYSASIVTVDVKTANDATKDLKIPLIDVREVTEFQEAAPLQGKNFPLSVFDPSSFGESVGISKSDAVYVICRSGSRSLRAAKQLEAAGFTKIYNVSGGMLAWQANGLPLKQNK
jgi:rhodanese-related sulfurtransferase